MCAESRAASTASVCSSGLAAACRGLLRSLSGVVALPLWGRPPPDPPKKECLQRSQEALFCGGSGGGR
eukprot:7912188-Alexandrium_andersonii.AAC.1